MHPSDPGDHVDKELDRLSQNQNAMGAAISAIQVTLEQRLGVQATEIRKFVPPAVRQTVTRIRGSRQPHGL